MAAGFFVVWGLACLGVTGDAINRKLKERAVIWFVGSFLLGPFILPHWFASRPLKKGETREGGWAWNFLKNIAILWSVLCLLLGIYMLQALNDQEPPPSMTGSQETDTAIGMLMSLFAVGLIWIVPMIVAMVLGYFLKNSSVIEKGPTGPLAKAEAEPTTTVQ